MKFEKYKDYNQHIVLCEDVQEIEPYYIKLPDAPKPEQFKNFGKDPMQQFYVKDRIPDKLLKLNRLDREEAFEIAKKDKECADYISMVWDKRINGEWVYINGIPTYITGLYYFYLNFYNLDIGLPSFRMNDLEYFYWWKYCVEDNPRVYGGVDFSRRRIGKCFGKDTKIRMYDGSVKCVQDILNGELVMGNDSTPRIVSGVTSGSEMMYKIIPKKGDGFICNESHILTLHCNKQVKTTKYFKIEDGGVVNISVKDYLNLPKNLYNHLCLYRTGWGENYEEANHYIDPYILGVYLGDGVRNVGAIVNIDIEVIDEVKNFALKKGFDVINYDKICYRLNTNHDADGKKWTLNKYKQELRRLNVFCEKRIPKEYLFDSRKNRLDLLAGLLDTDGTLNKKQRKKSDGFVFNYEITQKNKELAENIVELSRSLGFYTKMSKKIASMKRSNGSMYLCDVYRITICGNINEIPCRVKRKQVGNYFPRNNPLRTGFHIEQIGVGDYFGFSVDKNSLFLLEDGTVVHNTYRAGAMMLEYITRNQNSFVGSQSKTDEDANSLFHKAIVSPFRRLPFFFKPIYDTTGKMKKEISFTDNGRSDEALESWIDYRSSTETAYDGEKLHRYFMDECGKMKPPTDPVKMWDKVKPCVIEDDKIIGKALLDTTCEEMERGGLERFLEIWNDSSRKADDKKLNELGETLTGLVPHFMGAHKCFIWDRFGYPIIDNPTGYQLHDREKQSTKEDIAKGLHRLGAKEYLDLKFRSIKDQKKKQDEIRKFPRTVTEAFRSSATHCHFNLGIINDRMSEYIFDPEKGKVRGNFEWKGGELDSEVVWRPTENGRWLMSYIFPHEYSNAKVLLGGKKAPANTDKAVIGCDPFKYNVTTSNKPSRGAGYQWMYYDDGVDGGKEEKDWITDDFVGEYLYRQPTTDLFAEDMLMWAIYVGCRVNAENNADIISKHFVRRGYEKYLHFGKKLVKKDGQMQVKENVNSGATTLGGAMKDSLFASVDWWVETHGHRCKFPNLLESCRDVSYDNISPFDAFVAAAYTLMPVRELKQRPKVEPKSFTSFVPRRTY